VARVSIVLVVVGVVLVWNLGIGEVADVAHRSLQREEATPKEQRKKDKGVNPIEVR